MVELTLSFYLNTYTIKSYFLLCKIYIEDKSTKLNSTKYSAHRLWKRLMLLFAVLVHAYHTKALLD